MKLVFFYMSIFLFQTSVAFAGRISIDDFGFDDSKNEIIIYLSSQNCSTQIKVGETELECFNGGNQERGGDTNLSIAASCKKGKEFKKMEFRYSIATEELLETVKKCKSKKIVLDLNSGDSVKPFPISVATIEAALKKNDKD